VVGVALLLSNFLLLGDFSLVTLAPLLLVVLGAVVLLRGDLVPSNHFRAFGITRGSIESATLEINAADIDVNIQALQTPERLIAGQYANLSRPELLTDGTHATLRLDRAKTSLLTFADWDLNVAQAMPWTIAISTYVGQVQADLSQVILDTAKIHTGMGDIHLVAPYEVLGEPLVIRSLLGTIHIQTPPQYNVQIRVKTHRFFGAKVDTTRYDTLGDDVYQSRDSDPQAPLVSIEISGTFGDAYLA
jgi:hypothetical protein